MKNFKILTRSKLQKFGLALARLRGSVVCESVRGGCTSIEITNEGNGWHVHAHSLVDVRWLDMEKLSKKWGRLVGQNFAIVKIKDVRQQDYLKEICKYVVDGSELAKWPAEQIMEFVSAIRGKNMFFSFGNLRKLAPAIRAEIKANKQPHPVCECGCGKFIFTDQLAEERKAIEREARAAASENVRRVGQMLSRYDDTNGTAIQLHQVLHTPNKTSNASHFRTHGELRSR
jgi:hypothetical protein